MRTRTARSRPTELACPSDKELLPAVETRAGYPILPQETQELLGGALNEIRVLSGHDEWSLSIGSAFRRVLRSAHQGTCPLATRGSQR